MPRYRLTYSKTGDARFIGHLDETKFWERVFRRVDLPLAYSQGFNPQAKMQFAAALPVGVESYNDLLDMWTTEPIDPQTWAERIRRTLPPDFALLDLTEVSLDLPPMQASLRLAEYEARWGPDLSPELLAQSLSQLWAQPTLLRPHHKDPTRTYDLRPLIVSLDILPLEPGAGPALRMLLHSGPQGSARAPEVIAVLGLHTPPQRLIRTALILEEQADTVTW